VFTRVTASSTFPRQMVAVNSGNALVAAGPIADDVGTGSWVDARRNCNIHKQHTPNPNAAWWFRPRSAATSF
jgi:hypothetical protein